MGHHLDACGHLCRGLALNLTPCVYPLIPITFSYFGGRTGRSRGKLLVHGVSYIGGLSVTNSLPGVSAALTGGLMGAMLQNPYVLGVVAAILLFFATSLFGFRELRLPYWLTQKEYVKSKNRFEKQIMPGQKKHKYDELTIKVLSYLGLVYAVIGWLNEVLFQWTFSALLSHYSEYIAIGIFGTYRVVIEKNPYTKKRIAVLTAMVLGFWALLPYLFALTEPAIGYFNGKATWGRNLHVPMTLTFFLSLLLVLLFGRRAVCSWNCPCVGTRDTMGAAFRKETIKTDTAWKFRHLKWVLTSFYFALFVIVLLPFPKAKLLVDAFFGVVGVIYFTSFLFIPLTGNRNWCRWLCPYGQTFGVLNKAGFYKIKADKENCIACGKCTEECDMGIPVQQLVEAKGEVNVSDCVGCGRCVTNCPKKILSFSDVRNLFKRTLFAVESGRPKDADPGRKEINVKTSAYRKNGGDKPAVIKPLKGEQRMGSLYR